MAKTKAELLDEAKTLGLNLPEKVTIADINQAIKGAKVEKKEAAADVIAHREATVAKAGKRSEKSLKETKEKTEKSIRKEAGDTSAQGDVEAHLKKGPRPSVRSKLERKGKKYREMAKKIDKTNHYNLSDGLKLAVDTNPAKFDASVEIHVRLGVDPRQADQNIRASISLPHGTGKSIRVAVFAPETEHGNASKAGADIVGDEDFLKQLDSEVLNFDVLITSPQYMPRLGKYARILGPRGLMPNPKAGTVTTDIKKAVTESKAGKVEYRVDKQAIIHLSIGKVSFGQTKLEDNAKVFFDSLNSQRPASLKGIYVHTTTLSTTMGPSIKLENIVN